MDTAERTRDITEGSQSVTQAPCGWGRGYGAEEGETYNRGPDPGRSGGETHGKQEEGNVS